MSTCGVLINSLSTTRKAHGCLARKVSLDVTHDTIRPHYGAPRYSTDAPGLWEPVFFHDNQR